MLFARTLYIRDAIVGLEHGDVFGERSVRQRAHDAIRGRLRPSGSAEDRNKAMRSFIVVGKAGPETSWPGCSSRLLASYHAVTVGSVLLAMEIAGMRRSMEREMIESRDVVLIHTVAERWRIRESGNQHAGERAETDVDDIVIRPASAERPTGVVAAERTQAALLRERRRGDGQVDAGNIRNVDARANPFAAWAEPSGRKHRSGCRSRKTAFPMNCANCWIIGGLAAIPVILHRKRNQRLDRERIAHAIHLDVVAEIQRVGRAGPDGHLLAHRRGPCRRSWRSAMSSCGNASIGGHCGDGNSTAIRLML